MLFYTAFDGGETTVVWDSEEMYQQIKKFLGWALTEGQTFAPDLKYAPLPPAVVQKETAQIQQIQIP